MVPRPALLSALAAATALAWSCGGSDPAPQGTAEAAPYPVYEGPPVGAAPADTVEPKVMIIGLDGADFRNIAPLAEAGRLPHLTRLMAEGVHGALETVATASPVVWTSVATGLLPEKHGIQAFRTDDNRPVGTTLRKAPAFWNILSYYRRTVGVVSWWATFPAERVDGYLISPYVVLQPPVGLRARAEPLGTEADSLRKAYPAGLHDELADLLLQPEDLDLSQYADLHADIQRTTNTPWVIAKDQSYYEMALRLLDQRPVETVAVYFQGVDAASHDWDRWVMGPNKDEVRQPKVSPEEVAAADRRVEAMYVRTDAMVGGLLAKARPETDIIVLSDHGWNYDGTSHWAKLPGIFVARGPSFAAKGSFEGLSVLDVTPIMLAILGIPLSREFDGKVPQGLLTEKVMAQVTYVDGYGLPPVALPDGFDGTAPGLDAAMIERLRTLGYVGDDKLPSAGQDGGGTTKPK